MIEFDTSITASDVRKRTRPWEMILIHHTGIGDRKGPEISDALWATLGKNIAAYLARKDDIYVSAHYQIDRDGKIRELADPVEFVTFHAGKSQWWSTIERKMVENLNDRAIGIELIGDGTKIKYTDAQYRSLASLCRYLMVMFETIQPCSIQGHEAVSPGRKNDPGQLFDWRQFFNLLYLEPIGVFSSDQ